MLKKKIRPKNKTLYAVTAGDYLGKFLLFINYNKEKDTHDTLAIGEGRELNAGGFSAMEIPHKAFVEGVENKIIEKVDKVSKTMYNLLYKQWEFEKNKGKDESNN